MAVLVRILGPLEVVVDGATMPVRGTKRRRMLALLAARASTVTSLDAICDAIWSDQPLDRARPSVQTYVSQFRRTMAVVATPAGYQLDRRTVSVDAYEFERLVAELIEVDAAATSRQLDEALGLWQGPALTEFVDQDWAAPLAARWEELRRHTEDQWFAAERRAGSGRRIIPRLEEACAAEPMRESRWVQLIGALADAGRPAEALRAFGRIRATLRDEMGVNPSRALQDLELALLREEPERIRSDIDPQHQPVVVAAAGSDAPALNVIAAADPGRARSAPLADTQTRAVMFTDIIDVDEWQPAVGNPAADALQRVHDDLVTATVHRRHGWVVDGTGVGMMAVFDSATAAVDCAVDIQHALARYRRRHDNVALHLRIGIAVGDVAFDRGDHRGLAVTEAARLTNAAPADAIVVSELAARLAGTRAAEPFTSPELSDLVSPGATPAHRVDWQHRSVPSPLPLPDLVASPGEIAFAGREAELGKLAAAWAAADRARRQVVIVTGEPGIGKTRLVAEVARLAHRDGGIVLYGRCDEGLGAPFRPVVEALRHIVHNLAAPQLSVVSRAAGPELLRLLPELEGAFERREAMSWESDVARVRLFDAVASFVAALAVPAPVLLVLDDLQWADEATLLLVRHLLTRSPRVPLCVVATYRDTELQAGHPLLALVADLHREDGVLRVPLAGLDDQSAAALAAAADREHTLHLADSNGGLLEKANGNPFFILQLVRHLTEEGAPDAGIPTASLVPAGVREVIRRRLARLPEQASSVLGVAAAIGEVFDLALLESVHRTGDELDAVEAAVAAALVAETTTPTSFRFVHALVRETLYQDLSTARRARMHRAIGDALVKRPGAPAADVARHLRAGAAAGGVDAAIEWSFIAIEAAFSGLAREDVAGHAIAALEILDGINEQQSERRARMLCELAVGCSWLGDMAERRTHALAAADMARAIGSAPLLIDAVIVYTDYLSPASPDPAARQLLDEALRVAGSVPAATRAQLLCHYVAHHAVNEGGGHAGMQQLLEEALQLARSSGDDLAMALALTTRCLLLQGTPDAEALLRITSELEEVLDRSPQTRATVRDAAYRRRLGPGAAVVVRHRAVAALQLGDRAAFDHGHRELRNLADLTDDVLLTAIAILWDGLVAIMEGRVDAADVLLDQLARASPAGDRNLGYSYAGQLFSLRRDQGRIAEVLPMLEGLAASTDQLVAAQALLAVAYTELGRDADARQIFDTFAADGFTHVPRDWTWSFVLGALVEVCWHVRDREAARLLDRLCEPYAGQLLVIAWGVCCLGAMDRYRGMLADVLGQPSVADRRFAAAERLERAVNAVAPLARTRLAWATSLVRTDPQRARQLTDLAARTIKDLRLHGEDTPSPGSS